MSSHQLDQSVSFKSLLDEIWRAPANAKLDIAASVLGRLEPDDCSALLQVTKTALGSEQPKEKAVSALLALQFIRDHMDTQLFYWGRDERDQYFKRHAQSLNLSVDDLWALYRVWHNIKQTK